MGPAGRVISGLSLWFIAIALVPGLSTAEPACGVEGPCEVAGGSYRVAPPRGWDGKSKLPAAMFFHGWQASADSVMADAELRRTFSEAGQLLVLPDGQGKTWSHQGSPSQARDEIAFIRAVVDDLLRRWPVDREHLWATGFSQGASMVWDVACRGGGFTAYVAISGQFWEPHPKDCPAGPMNLLQIHGLADDTFPLEGQPIRAGRFAQGELFRSLELMRAVDGCPRQPSAFEQTGPFTLRLWEECSTGRRIGMALHPGGHTLPEGWLDVALSWMRGPPPR